jgi:hypothetical protein
VHPDGRHVAWGLWGGGRIRELSVTGGEAPRDLLPASTAGHADRERPAWSFESGLAYGPNGATLVQAADEAAWSARALETARIVAYGPPRTERQNVADLVVHPDGERMVSAGPGSTVSVCDRRTGRLLQALVGHTDQVFAVAVHPGGRVLASGGNDNTIRIWDLEAGGESVTLTGHAFYVHDLAFTPDGRTLVSASGDGTVRLWSTRPLAERRAAARAERERARSLAPRVQALFESLGDALAVSRAVEDPGFDLDAEQSGTARDLVLRESVRRAVKR